MKDCPPEVQLALEKVKETILKEIKDLYAIKLVEKIVFGGIGLALIALFTALLTLIIKK